MFLLGIFRGAAFMLQLAPYQELVGTKVVLRGRAVNDGAYNDRRQLEFDIEDIEIIEPYNLRLPGRMRISGFGEPAVFRTDLVQAEGKMYKTRGSRQAGVSFAEINTIEHDLSKLEMLRLKFTAGMQTALPEPHASFAAGLLVGQRNTLPDAVSEQLSSVGLTHIIAVSGYNLTIIMQAVRRGLSKGSKYQATVIAVVLMSGFLLVTGFSASIVRAAIVSGLGLWAWYYGRSFKPLLLIVLSAAITAAWNPLYLWSDIGWYLSFLAFFGVLILAPLVTQKLFARREPKLFGQIAMESLCAQIMTVPLIIWIFKEISLVAPISNILIVPLVPLAMLLALIAGVAGMHFPLLAGWAAWPAKILLTYMLDMVNIISGVPNALHHTSVSAITMSFMYGSIGVFALALHKGTHAKRATITDIESGI